jgi:L-aminopeptidase/D-esterase-like protein
MSVTLLSTLASNASKVEDPVKGTLAKPIIVSGTTVVPAGSQINGSVISAAESGRVKGRASVAFQFERLVVGGEPYRIQTAQVKREAAADTRNDVKKGAVGAGAGAIVGGVVGGGKGAAIGAVAGGTAAVVGTKGQEVQLQPGTVVTALLQEPLTVRVPLK